MSKQELTYDRTKDGHVTFDGQQRLADCNQIYREMYGLPDRLSRPGATFLDTVRHLFEQETGVSHAEALREAQSWTATHVEQMALGNLSAHLHFLSDGRVMHVRNEPTTAGGWTEIHKDITAKCRSETQILRVGSRHDAARKNMLDEHLRDALSRAALGERFALLFLEVDAFKAVSSAFGDPIKSADLREALAAGEFELKYQPIFSLSTNQIVSSEALIRWRKPDLGLVLPGEFIQIAEQSGFMVELGDWIMKQACSDAATWPDNVRVAVNVSTSQLKAPGFVRTIEDALDESGLSASRLEIEIPEKALLQATEPTLDTLRAVRKAGIRIALEDFGAGYSSLIYLTNFPVDIIKIDPSLINTLAAENSAREMFRAIASLARSIARTTTAKGIESQTQLDLARAVGCEEAQGYMICPPLPVEGADRVWQPHPQYTDRSARDVEVANAAR